MLIVNVSLDFFTEISYNDEEMVLKVVNLNHTFESASFDVRCFYYAY